MSASTRNSNPALPSFRTRHACANSLVPTSNSAPRQTFRTASTLCFAATLSAITLTLPAHGQVPQQQPTESVVQAAQSTRERIAEFKAHANVISNDTLAAQLPIPGSSQPSSPSSANAAAESPISDASSCQNPAEAQALATRLQDAQDQRDQIQHDLSQQAPVISDNDLDLSNFKPGSSGMNVGGPPLLESQPEAPGRIAEVALNERIASLKKNLQLACDSPEAAPIQAKLDAIDVQLNWSQRQFALDQNAFYSNPNYATDTAGQANLDAEQRDIASLQAEKDRLTDELAATTNQPPPST